MATERFYILAAGDVAGETAAGPYSKIEADMRAPADPAAKIVTEAQLEALRARPQAEIDTITLTTANAASSDGMPVLVIDGTVYGPADMTPAGIPGAALVTKWAARFTDQMTNGYIPSDSYVEDGGWQTWPEEHEDYEDEE